MDSLIRSNNEYKTWVESISSRYKKYQIKAAVKVNAEMLKFYYNLGREIFELKTESKWGSGFYQNLSYDLSVHLPNIKGFSVTNLILFVRPRFCIRLTSDSTSRWTPLSSTNSSYFQACSGLSPPSYCPFGANYKKRCKH